MAPLAESLAAAAAAVARVATGRSLSEALSRAQEEAPTEARAAVADLCFGTLRRYGRGQAIVTALARRAGATEPVVEALLWCALYALDSKRYAEYTVVDQAARACRLLHQHRATPFVNGLLRAYLRAGPGLQARLEADAQARYWHPDWWIARVRDAYPECWQDILAAGNSHPPMCLRVNARRIEPAEYARRLEAQGIASRAAGPVALLLEQPLPVDRLPGFADGLVSVQDAGAQRAAEMLDLRSGQRVLDACAAPGGKTAHILERADVELTALDIDAVRRGQIERNLARLGLRASAVRPADAAVPEQWWDGMQFDRILADVPCSASGVARRHPDIKWLRRASDIAPFAARQSRILEALWRALAPGGKLLYVTCSVFPEENGAVLDDFVARSGATPGARLQLLPDAGQDGFFFALLEKKQPEAT